MRTSRSAGSGRVRFLTGCRVMVAVLLLGAPQVRAQVQHAGFQEAVESYQFADFDAAIGQLTALAEDPALDREMRKQVYQYLGRSYVARNRPDKAREAILELLDLEPPLIEFDPDIESPPLMRLYYEVRKAYGGFKVQKRETDIKTLAVMDFTNNSLTEKERYDPLQQGFASMMIHHLNGATDLKVVERERIQWLLDELELQRTPALVDQSTAVQTSKLLGAHAVLFGAFTVHKRQMWISARLIRVETGEVLMSEQLFTKPDDFFEAIQKLSLQVAKAIDVTLLRADLGARTETKSLDAMLSYSEGLALLEKEDYVGAYEKFLEAVAYDPDYTRARLKAESLRPVLAGLPERAEEPPATSGSKI